MARALVRWVVVTRDMVEVPGDEARPARWFDLEMEHLRQLSPYNIVDATLTGTSSGFPGMQQQRHCVQDNRILRYIQIMRSSATFQLHPQT